jgi:hypothetical protein
LPALKEALPRRRLGKLANHGHAHQLAILVREPQHPAQDGKLAIDRAVGRALPSPLLRILGDLCRSDRHHPPTSEELPEVIEPCLCSRQSRFPVVSW